MPARPSHDEPRFSVTVERQDEEVVFRLAGELDLDSQATFQEALDEATQDGTGRLVIDMRGLRFIDSSGLKTLIMLWKDLRSDGREFTVIPADGQVRKVLRITGVDAVLPLDDGAPS